jgi:multiple antibiotic resistance protein
MLDVALHAFTTLFVVIDPLGLVPVLLALTIGVAAAERRRMALKGTLIAAVILLGFALFGEPLLRLLGIGLPAFRTAGGVMLLLIALEMVFERRTDRRSRSADELKSVGGPDDISVFPLAIPLLSGPGAITSIMLLMARRRRSWLQCCFW